MKKPKDKLQKGGWLQKKEEYEARTSSDTSTSKKICEFRGTVTCIAKFFERSVRRFFLERHADKSFFPEIFRCILKIEV